MGAITRTSEERPGLVQANCLNESRHPFSGLTPIQVPVQGVIWDGHHAVRVVAERGETVDVVIVNAMAPASGLTILQLPVK